MPYLKKNAQKHVCHLPITGVVPGDLWLCPGCELVYKATKSALNPNEWGYWQRLTVWRSRRIVKRIRKEQGPI